VVNAIAHRDDTITGIDIDLAIYSDRLEIFSPGRLPNTVTVAKMRAGYRASRNELIKEILRDYRYVEATGWAFPGRSCRACWRTTGPTRTWSGKTTASSCGCRRCPTRDDGRRGYRAGPAVGGDQR